MKNIIPLVIVAVIIAAIAWTAGRMSAPNPKDSTATANLPEEELPIQNPESKLKSNTKKEKNPDKEFVRRQIAEIVEKEVGSMKEIPELDAYLDQLERQAIDKGIVSALEVQPGFEAIERFAGKLGPEAVQEKMEKFGQRMEELSKEMKVEEEATYADVDALFDQIALAQSNEEKQDFIRKYIEATDGLEPEKQIEAMQKLDDLVASGQEAVTPSNLDELYNQIANAKDNEKKQELIGKFIQGASQLEPDEEMAAMERLDEIAGSHE